MAIVLEIVDGNEQMIKRIIADKWSSVSFGNNGNPGTIVINGSAADLSEIELLRNGFQKKNPK